MNAQGSLIPRLLAALALAAMAACSPPELQDTAPGSDLSEAPPAYAPSSPPPEPPSETALLGGPANPLPPSPPPPAYAPPPAPEFVQFKMAPIPNPPEPEPAARAVQHAETQSPVARPSSVRTAAAKPAASEDARPSAKSPPVAAAGTPAARLGTALAADISSGSRLSIPDGLSAGRDGIVVLSMPSNLAARLKDEAAKLGLGDAAKTANIRATLTGQGYDIMPSGTQVARLGENQVKFSWQVSEIADPSVEKQPLRAEVAGELKTGRVTQSFPLASLGALPVSAPKASPSEIRTPFKSADGLALAIPLLLILIALFILGRWAKTRQVDKDRRRATLAEFHT